MMSFKPRYILAQEAEERIVALFRKEKGDAAEIFNTAIDACQSIILDMYDNSSENVVPVVRCKDCKWKVVTKLKENYCLRCEDIVKDDYFCADGAKMDVSDNDVGKMERSEE